MRTLQRGVTTVGDAAPGPSIPGAPPRGFLYGRDGGHRGRKGGVGEPRGGTSLAAGQRGRGGWVGCRGRWWRRQGWRCEETVEWKAPHGAPCLGETGRGGYRGRTSRGTGRWTGDDGREKIEHRDRDGVAQGAGGLGRGQRQQSGGTNSRPAGAGASGGGGGSGTGGRGGGTRGDCVWDEGESVVRLYRQFRRWRGRRRW